jgi:hypothetical protein
VRMHRTRAEAAARAAAAERPVTHPAEASR